MFRRNVLCNCIEVGREIIIENNFYAKYVSSVSHSVWFAVVDRLALINKEWEKRHILFQEACAYVISESVLGY